MIERKCLELTADLMSHSETLPAVATCTWCESAAAALCVARSRCVAIVRFVDRDSGAPLGSPWPSVGVASRPVNQPLIDAVRSAAGQDPGGSDATNYPDRLDPCIEYAAAAITLAPHANESDPLLSLLGFVGGRSALLACAAIDPGRGISLRIVIAESAASDDEPFAEPDAEALRAGMRRMALRARQAFASTAGVEADPLNRREAEVLESLARGQTIRQIADQMHKSTHTIHDYLKSMHRKVGVGCRAELIARAAGRCEPRTATKLTETERVA